jgi:hypothetical protein
MQLYLAIKYYPDARNRPLIEAITAALAAAGHSTVCVARDLETWGAEHFAPDELMRRSFHLIDAADLVLVELSEKGVGLGIEAGYAHGQGIPVVVAARTGADISTTLAGIAAQLLFYDDPTELAALLLAPAVVYSAGRTTWEYIASSVDRLLACLSGLDRAALDWRPIPTANSLFVLATHLIGNIEETVWGVVCGNPVQRDRAAEFQAEAVDPAQLQQHWQDLHHKIEQHLTTLTAAEMAAPRTHPRRGPMNAREILLVVARHAAEHLAHAELTRDLLAATQPLSVHTEATRYP